jgi:UDP-glucose 4-epimerase
MSITQQTILVTGGAGFIGSHLVEKLVRQQNQVHVVDDLTTGYTENLASVQGQIQFHHLDLAHDPIRPLLNQTQPAIIFHLAANGYVPPSVENPRLDLEKNILATFNLLEALRESEVKTSFIYTSTAAVYGHGAEHPLQEDDPTVPVAPYGVSKLACERYTAVYAQLYGLKTASLRLFPVYGRRLRKQVIYDLIQKLHDNPEELFIYGDGSQVRDINHVNNVVNALLLAAENGRLHGETYNVGSGQPVTIRALAEAICQAMSLAPRFVFSGEVRPGDAQNWTADLTRLQQLGYVPQTSLQTGLSEMVALFLEEINQSDTQSPTPA